MSRRPTRQPSTAPRRTHWPERAPWHCYDWISPEDIVRHALAAFYMTSRRINKLPPDPTGANAEFNNGRAWFAEELAEIFELRLQEQGFKAGAPGFSNYATESLRNRSENPTDRDIHRAQSHNENGR